MKVPYNETESFNYIVQQELQDRQNDFILTRISRSPSSFFSSEELSNRYTKKGGIPDEEVSFDARSYLIFLSFFTICCSSFSLSLFLNPAIENIYRFFSVLFLIFVFIGFFVEIRKEIKIKIFTAGIQVNDIPYNWAEINKIYFISRPVSRGTRDFIVLILDTGTSDKYEITNLVFGFTANSKIAGFIEHFRNLA